MKDGDYEEVMLITGKRRRFTIKQGKEVKNDKDNRHNE